MRWPFGVLFALKLRWSVEYPLPGRWAGPYELLPSPFLPPPLPISEAWAPSLPYFPSRPCTSHSSCRLGTSALDLLSGLGCGRNEVLGAEEGSLLPKALGRPYCSPSSEWPLTVIFLPRTL